MTFFCDLGVTLGKSLGEILSLSVVEIDIWREHYVRHGFPVDQIKWTNARSGAAVANAFGSKVRPVDLVPRFGAVKPLSNRALAAQLAALPGAKVEFTPHGQ